MVCLRNLQAEFMGIGTVSPEGGGFHKGVRIAATSRATQRRGASKSLAPARKSPTVKEQSQELLERKAIGKSKGIIVPNIKVTNIMFIWRAYLKWMRYSGPE